VDLEPIVAAAVDRTAAEAERRGITVAPPETGAIVKGDAALLEEVFVNLLVNALEHSPPAGRVDVTIDRDGDACRVAVIDHGPGVPPADVPGLFERFHTGKAGGGHGIGLALSRIIARSHGGDVTHAPTPGGGATFTVRLPALA
jgi:signal transduction histidine kinase